MDVNVKEFLNLCESGKQPIIKINENIYETTEKSFEAQMMGKVIEVSLEYDDNYRLLVDMNGYEKHNRSIAEQNRKYGSDELKLSWFETKHYPEDGIEILYISLDSKMPFEIANDNDLFSDYLNSDYDSYVDFLEGAVKWLIEQNKELRGNK